MAGILTGGLRFANPQDVGSVSATSDGTAITSGAAFTKGSWTTLIAATGADCSWVMFQAAQTGSFGHTYAFDIGIGGVGNAVSATLVTNLLFPMPNVVNFTCTFPLTIRAGTRIAVRVAAETASAIMTCRMTTFDDTFGSAGVASSVDTYGFNAATNTGTTIDSGVTANALGSYSAISASLTNDISGFFLVLDGNVGTTSASTTVFMLFNVAVGAAGSEKVILPNLMQTLVLNTTLPSQGSIRATPYFPIPIRAGTRVAINSQSQTAVSPDRKFNATFYGIRQ